MTHFSDIKIVKNVGEHVVEKDKLLECIEDYINYSNERMLDKWTIIPGYKRENEERSKRYKIKKINGEYYLIDTKDDWNSDELLINILRRISGGTFYKNISETKTHYVLKYM